MAIFALTGQVITVNGTDISAYCKSATLTFSSAELDTTDFASSGWQERIGGLKDYSLSLELMDDYAASAIDDDLFAVFNTVVTFALKPANGAISTSNPEYQGSVLINQLPGGGGVGELAMKSVTWPGSGAIVRDTTP